MTAAFPFSILLVAAGGFVGAIARFGLSRWAAKRFPSSIPYGTLTVNLIGCLAIGVLWGHKFGSSELLFAGTGFMGAFTTFSTFKLEAASLIRQGKPAVSVAYMALSYGLGLLLTYIGYNW